MLGELRSPLLWEPLAARWRSLPPADRSEYMQARTARMTEDGHLIKLCSGDSRRPRAPYAVSPELGILLAARSRPTFAVMSRFSSRLPPFSLFAVGDEAEPVRGVITAFAVRLPAWGEKPARPRYVADVFAHILTTAARAAELLANWVITPAPAHGRFRKQQPPRLVALFRPRDGNNPAAELSVLGNGTTAQVTGTAVTGELDKETLQAALLDLFARGAATA